ncbi:MAG: hypothetical protein OES47_07790 [Acidobacteriota bacterium]|nr:hypothetical protein [Acidobacteriota bacterium]
MWNQKIPADCLEVLEVSSILPIGEFELFRLAYASWYGRQADEETLEEHFVPYMFRDQVPFWVRSFTRKVLSLERDGSLDPSQFGIESPRPQEGDRLKGLLYAFGIGLALVGLIRLAEAAAPLLTAEGCWFPPCY